MIQAFLILNAFFQTKDMYEVARLVQALPKKSSERKRVVVITRGADPALVCNADGQVNEYPAGRIADADIADTNGAGDGFVGGFLSQYIQGHSLARCMACGHYTAGEVIRQHGVKVPAKSSFVFDKEWRASTDWMISFGQGNLLCFALFNSTSFLLLSVPENWESLLEGGNFTLTGYLVLVAVNFSGVIIGA